mgnify:FL=1
MKNYTYAALDDILDTLCSRVDELRNAANSRAEYYKSIGEEITDEEKKDLEKLFAIANLIEQYIKKNFDPII